MALFPLYSDLKRPPPSLALSLQHTAISLEPLSLAHRSSSSSSFRTMLLPPPRLQPPARLQLQASRVASSHPIHLREPSNIHQEPSLPKTIPPRPPSLPITACRPAPSPAQDTNPVLATPRLQAAQSPPHQELLTRTLVTGPLTARATLSPALDTGKGGQQMLLILIHPSDPLLFVAPSVWRGCRKYGLLHCTSPPPPPIQISPNMKQESAPL